MDGDRRRRGLTILEVAEYLSIGRSSAYELAQTGQLKAKRFGKNIRIRIKELERYEHESDSRADG